MEPSPLRQPGTSRRDFITKSSLAVAAGGMALELGSARFAHGAEKDDTIKIGVIGCGGRGTGAAMQAISTEGPVKLVAMGDAFEDSVEKAYKNLENSKGRDGEKLSKDRLDCPKERRFSGLDAYKKVLECDVDLVVLATPPGYRPVHFEAAVKAGKHVFMEKPVAVDAAGVRRVLAAVAESKKKKLGVGVGLQRHHEKKYLETIKRIQDGEIGDIIAARAYWNGGGVWDPRVTREQTKSEMEYQVRNWYYYNWLSGDHINEQHIHNLDVINWVKNAYPIKAEGMGGRQVRVDPKYGEIYDHHAVEFEYADGSRMFSYCRHIPNCWNSVSEHLHGSKGTANVGGGEILVKGSDGWKYRGKGDGNPYQVEHDDLQASIRAGNPLNEGENGALSTMTAILGRMATYGGKEVKWEDALNSQIVLGPYDAVSWDMEPPAPVVAVPGQTKVV